MNALSHATSRDVPRSLRALYMPGLHAQPLTILIDAGWCTSKDVHSFTSEGRSNVTCLPLLYCWASFVLQYHAYLYALSLEVTCSPTLHLALAPLTPFPLFFKNNPLPPGGFSFWRWMPADEWAKMGALLGFWSGGGERAHFLGFCAVTSDVCVCKLNLFWDRK